MIQVTGPQRSTSWPHPFQRVFSASSSPCRSGCSDYSARRPRRRLPRGPRPSSRSALRRQSRCPHDVHLPPVGSTPDARWSSPLHGCTQSASGYYAHSGWPQAGRPVGLRARVPAASTREQLAQVLQLVRHRPTTPGATARPPPSSPWWTRRSPTTADRPRARLRHRAVGGRRHDRRSCSPPTRTSSPAARSTRGSPYSAPRASRRRPAASRSVQNLTPAAVGRPVKAHTPATAGRGRASRSGRAPATTPSTRSTAPSCATSGRGARRLPDADEHAVPARRHDVDDLRTTRSSCTRSPAWATALRSTRAPADAVRQHRRVLPRGICSSYYTGMFFGLDRRDAADHAPDHATPTPTPTPSRRDLRERQQLRPHAGRPGAPERRPDVRERLQPAMGLWNTLPRTPCADVPGHWVLADGQC